MLEALEDFSEENVKAVLMAAGPEERNEDRPDACGPSASPFPACSPPPAAPLEIAYLLGKDETLRRMKLGVEKLEKR